MFNDYPKGVGIQANSEMATTRECEDIVSTPKEIQGAIQRIAQDIWFNLDMTVLRPDNGVMMQLIQYDVVENEEENDGSTMVKGTENLNLLDDAELFKVSSESSTDDAYIGATEY